MVDAVNTIIANNTLSRATIEQASTAVAQPQAQQAAPPPAAPFISPRVAIDSGSNQAILQIRDASTGDVVNQFPSESRLRAIQAQQARESASSTRQSELTGTQDQAPSVPVQTFDAGAIATLQAPQGVSSSDAQLATVAFASSNAPAPSQSSVSVTA
ncbi:MAG: hypothetical protein AB8B83_09520 [Bdellovibrionales bacterium]